MLKFFSLLGLCKRANKLAAGEVAAEQAIRSKQMPVYLLILAGFGGNYLVTLLLI